MAEKVTTMVLKVDLQCPSCYKKIKRVLCKFPQIRDQVYDQKQNTVTITVICCSPEKIRDKLCCKGGKTIKSIEIKVPEKPKPPPEKPKEPEKPKPPPEKPKEPEKPKPPPEKPKEPEKPKPPPEKPKEPEKPKPPPEKPKEAPKQPAPAPITVYPCYVPCYEGHPGGPCYDGHGRPAPPPPCYDFYGRQCDGYGRPCHVSRCDLYFCEENPSGCTIM